MTTFEKKAYYSPTEFAELVGVDPSTVMEWIHSESLYAVHLGPRTYRIPLAVVMNRLAPEEVKPARRVKVIDPTLTEEAKRFLESERAVAAR